MLVNELSQRANDMRSSLIRHVAEQGMGQPDIIPLWFGEGCWPTSDIAVKAANKALAAGDHFYHVNSGQMSLRTCIASYQSSLYQRALCHQNITVTASGMQALSLTAQALVNPSDKVIYIDPVWPNLPEVFKLSGAQLEAVSLKPKEGRWHLDMDYLFAKLTPDHKVVLVNSPNNPTGWVMAEEDQKALVEYCRRHGIWIVSDDVYARLCLGQNVAPGFQHHMAPEERLVSVNSFSKAWSMTGWRLGWITAPAALEAPLAALTEFNIACPAGFIQQAGEAMIKGGESEVKTLQMRLSKAFEVVKTRLDSIEGLSFTEPQGAFYILLKLAGRDDSVKLAIELLQNAGVGLAPGAAFGAAAEGYLRLCYAQEIDRLNHAFDKIEAYLGRSSI